MKYVLKRLFGEEFNNLLLLNLLTVGLCIPVVTAGPAILAMKGTLVKILDDRCDLRRVHEFWGLFKKKFWKGLLFEVLFILYGMMLLWCKSLADNVGGSAVSRDGSGKGQKKRRTVSRAALRRSISIVRKAEQPDKIAFHAPAEGLLDQARPPEWIKLRTRRPS